MELIKDYIRICIKEAIKLGSRNSNKVALDSFMAEWFEKTWDNPMNHRERIVHWDKVKGIDSFVVVELGSFDNKIHISSIQVLPASGRGAGLASIGLKFILDLADKHQVELDLEPHEFGGKGLSNDELGNWYARAGIAWDKDHYSMIRKPKSL